MNENLLNTSTKVVYAYFKNDYSAGLKARQLAMLTRSKTELSFYLKNIIAPTTATRIKLLLLPANGSWSSINWEALAERMILDLCQAEKKDAEKNPPGKARV